MSLARPVLIPLSGLTLFLKCDIFRSWSEKCFGAQDRNRAAERKRAGKFRQKLTTIVTVLCGTGIHTALYWNELECLCLVKSRSFNLSESDLTLYFCFNCLSIYRPFYILHWGSFCLIITQRAYCHMWTIQESIRCNFFQDRVTLSCILTWNKMLSSRLLNLGFYAYYVLEIHRYYVLLWLRLLWYLVYNIYILF